MNPLDVFGSWKVPCKGCDEPIVDEDSSVLVDGWTDEVGGRYCSQECADASVVEHSMLDRIPFLRFDSCCRREVIVMTIVRQLPSVELELTRLRPFKASEPPRQTITRVRYVVQYGIVQSQWVMPDAVRSRMQKLAGPRPLLGCTFRVTRKRAGFTDATRERVSYTVEMVTP